MTNEKIGEAILVVASAQREIPVSVRPNTTLIPQPTNVFALQLTPEGVVLTAGFALAPLFKGTPAEQRSQMDAMQEIEAEPSVRLLIPFHSLPQLIQMLTETNTHVATQLAQAQKDNP